MKRLVQPGAVRVPTARVLVAGSELPGLIDAEVTSNNHYQADHFRLQLALNAPGGKGLDWWGGDGLKGALFDVRLGMDGDERSLIVGEGDQIDIHPATGLVGIEGRDLTARFIDNKSQEADQNLTASEIISKIATRRGLTPIVTATTTKASRYYGADHDKVRHGEFSRVGTEWDLMKDLAQHEGFDLFVTGTELHFQPAADPEKADAYAVTWNQDQRVSDMTRLDLERSLTLGKDVVVVVRSWSSKKGSGFSRGSPNGADVAKVNSGKSQRYVFTFPNLTEDEAQKKADALRADITKHERKLSFDCPGELDLTPRDILAVTGVGGWDQRYFVDTIARRVSFESGFVETVSAKNHYVESQSA